MQASPAKTSRTTLDAVTYPRVDQEKKRRDIGWGTDNSNLSQKRDVRCLPLKDQFHKTYWDEDKTRLHMYTNGFHATHTDKKLGINFEEMEGLSIRN